MRLFGKEIHVEVESPQEEQIQTAEPITSLSPKNIQEIISKDKKFKEIKQQETSSYDHQSQSMNSHSIGSSSSSSNKKKRELVEAANNDDETRLVQDQEKKKKKRSRSSSKLKKKISEGGDQWTTLVIRDRPEPETLGEEILQRLRLEGGTEPVLLFRKILTESDLKDGLNRILVTGVEKLIEALTEEERNIVIHEKSTKGIQVLTIDPMGNQYDLHMKKWPSMRSQPIALNHEWKKLYMKNGLKKGDVVQGWGYRLNSKLQLAINYAMP